MAGTEQVLRRCHFPACPELTEVPLSSGSSEGLSSGKQRNLIILIANLQRLELWPEAFQVCRAADWATGLKSDHSFEQPACSSSSWDFLVKQLGLVTTGELINYKGSAEKKPRGQHPVSWSLSQWRIHIPLESATIHSLAPSSLWIHLEGMAPTYPGATS